MSKTTNSNISTRLDKRTVHDLVELRDHFAKTAPSGLVTFSSVIRHAIRELHAAELGQGEKR